MKKFIQLSFFIGIFILSFSTKSFAQSDRLRYLSYVFPADSLSGFNEIKASHHALNGGYFGSEYKVFMYRAKRDFINLKYNLESGMYNSKGLPPVINAAPCVNEGFEASPVEIPANVA